MTIMPIHISLEPWEYEWAKHVGTMRDEINRPKRNAAYYDESRMDSDNARANTLACCGEMAVAKHLNRYWSGDYWPLNRHNEFMHKADIKPNIEVRRITKPDNPLVIRERDAKKNRIMFLTYVDPKRYLSVMIIGWKDAKTGYADGVQPHWDQTGTARVYPQEKLNEPSTYEN